MRRHHSLSLIALLVLAIPAVSLAGTAPASGKSAPAHRAASSAPAKHAAKAPEMDKVNLNTATKEDLMKVSGIDDATADKIIAARPFKSTRELVSKNVLDKAAYAKVRSMVTVGHMSSGGRHKSAAKSPAPSTNKQR